MKKVILALISTMAFVTVVQAHNCPNIGAEIQAKLTEMADGDADKLAKVQEMHDAGMALHESGDHDGSVKMLEEALSMLTAE